MGKSAKCLQMLQLLKARGLMSMETLASELQTNKRNLIEYRKELEDAGYQIESITGRYGGYQLASDAYLPILKLSKEEQYALLDAQIYLRSTDFLAQRALDSAMDKLRVQWKPTDTDNIYMQDSQRFMDDDLRQWIHLCEQAIGNRDVVQLSYKGMKDHQGKEIVIHPYEILHYQSAYYCLAYSLKAKDFRNYKFSKERMKDARLLPQKFTRNHDFDVKDHVGALGLMKDDLHEIEILVSGHQALLVAEKEIGLHPQMVWKDDHTLYLKTIMEGKMNVLSFLLSLGAQVEILSPADIKDEILNILQEMYEKRAK